MPTRLTKAQRKKRLREWHRRYWQEHREELMKKRRAYRAAHRAEINQAWRDWIAAHPKNLARYRKKKNARRRRLRREARLATQKAKK